MVRTVKGKDNGTDPVDETSHIFFMINSGKRGNLEPMSLKTHITVDNKDRYFNLKPYNFENGKFEEIEFDQQSNENYKDLNIYKKNNDAKSGQVHFDDLVNERRWNAKNLSQLRQDLQILYAKVQKIQFEILEGDILQKH